MGKNCQKFVFYPKCPKKFQKISTSNSCMFATFSMSVCFQFILRIVHIHCNKVLTFEIKPIQGNVENVNHFKNKWCIIIHWILEQIGSNSCLCTKYWQLFFWALNILLFLPDKETHVEKIFIGCAGVEPRTLGSRWFSKLVSIVIVY